MVVHVAVGQLNTNGKQPRGERDSHDFERDVINIEGWMNP